MEQVQGNPKVNVRGPTWSSGSSRDMRNSSTILNLEMTLGTDKLVQCNFSSTSLFAFVYAAEWDSCLWECGWKSRLPFKSVPLSSIFLSGWGWNPTHCVSLQVHWAVFYVGDNRIYWSSNSRLFHRLFVCFFNQWYGDCCTALLAEMCVTLYKNGASRLSLWMS